jgi:hypothetical protein
MKKAYAIVLKDTGEIETLFSGGLEIYPSIELALREYNFYTPELQANRIIHLIEYEICE